MGSLLGRDAGNVVPGRMLGFSPYPRKGKVHVVEPRYTYFLDMRKTQIEKTSTFIEEVKKKNLNCHIASVNKSMGMMVYTAWLWQTAAYAKLM